MRRQAAEGLERRLAQVGLAPGMDDGAREAARALPRAAGLRARRHRPDEVPGLLPDRLRLHQMGQGQRHPGRAGPRLGRRLGRRLEPGRSPTSTRCASACCSSASSIPSACRCRTSTSTSARTGAHEVIAYVRDRYGADRVAQIITFGTLQARAALRDVGRVLGLPFGLVDRICKLVPHNPANPVTLAQAIEMEPRLQGGARRRSRAWRG